MRPEAVVDVETQAAEKCPRWYVYVLRDDAGEPFYIGKGCGTRAMAHVVGIDAAGGDEKRKLIESLKAQGRPFSIEFASWHHDSAAALVAERALIRQAGLRRDGSGKLTNRRAGDRTDRIGLRLESWLRRALEERARLAGCSLSAYVARVLEEHVAERQRSAA